jgi:hypothetical protein
MMGRHITMDQLRQDVGLMVEKITHVTLMFRRVCLRMEEYVCLKVITMLNQGKYIIYLYYNFNNIACFFFFILSFKSKNTYNYFFKKYDHITKIYVKKKRYLK